MKKVWLLCISHRHGVNKYVHKTEAGAYAELAEFAAQWWSERHPDRPIPVKESDIVSTYFDGHDDEYFEIESMTVLG